jgi:uncharacterized protein (DUF1330 family)
MSAYVISDIEITDPAAFADYTKLSPPSIERYGGRFVVRGGPLEVLEGSWTPSRLAIVSFPSVEVAKTWINSPEYLPARQARQRSARTGLIVVEGVPSWSGPRIESKDSM